MALRQGHRIAVSLGLTLAAIVGGSNWRVQDFRGNGSHIDWPDLLRSWAVVGFVAAVLWFNPDIVEATVARLRGRKRSQPTKSSAEAPDMVDTGHLTGRTEGQVVALAALVGCSREQAVGIAVDAYVRDLPADERLKYQELAARQPSRPSMEGRWPVWAHIIGWIHAVFGIGVAILVVGLLASGNIANAGRPLIVGSLSAAFGLALIGHQRISLKLFWAPLLAFALLGLSPAAMLAAVVYAATLVSLSRRLTQPVQVF
jgi:hypothetical protein